MKSPKSMTNKELLEAHSKNQKLSLIAVACVFACMAILAYFKLNYMLILVVAIPFAPFAYRFYTIHFEIQRRNLDR